MKKHQGHKRRKYVTNSPQILTRPKVSETQEVKKFERDREREFSTATKKNGGRDRKRPDNGEAY
jgi:hypothetical protein